MKVQGSFLNESPSTVHQIELTKSITFVFIFNGNGNTDRERSTHKLNAI